MTLYDFNSLNDFEKGDALREHGVHLSERFEGEMGYTFTNLMISTLRLHTTQVKT